MQETRIVSTTSGDVIGTSVGKNPVRTFFGIPYAVGTEGEQRFRRTQRMVANGQPVDARMFGPASAQLYDKHEGSLAEFGEAEDDPGRFYVGNEGPLTLNIWTPGLDNCRRPVIVFVHGGANWVGTSRLPLYHGDHFCLRGDVVFVSFNYRLGVLGFMEFGWMGGPEYQGSNANGLIDQLTALEWIRANIEQFGGDSNNVTLMGESAGSKDISWLLASGRLTGLVRRIVLMSGVGGNSMRHDYSFEGGCAAARKFMRLAEVDSMPRLLALSTKQLMDRHRAAFSKLHVFEQSMFTPRVDGVFLKGSPLEIARRNGASGIDVMVGHTGYEMGLYLLYDPTLDRRSSADQFAYLRIDDSTKADLVRLYDEVYAHEASGVRGMHLLSDIWFVMPSLLLADQLAETSSNVWVYEFAWRNPRSHLRAGHALDLCFWFDKTRIEQSRFLLGDATDEADLRERDELAATMQDALIAFARSGNPSTPVAPWPAYDPARRQVQVFDVKSGIASDPRNATRSWWTRNQRLFSGNWITLDPKSTDPVR